MVISVFIILVHDIGTVRSIIFLLKSLLPENIVRTRNLVLKGTGVIVTSIENGNIHSIFVQKDFFAKSTKIHFCTLFTHLWATLSYVDIFVLFVQKCPIFGEINQKARGITSINNHIFLLKLILVHFMKSS